MHFIIQIKRNFTQRNSSLKEWKKIILNTFNHKEHLYFENTPGFCIRPSENYNSNNHLKNKLGVGERELTVPLLFLFFLFKNKIIRKTATLIYLNSSNGERLLRSSLIYLCLLNHTHDDWHNASPAFIKWVILEHFSAVNGFCLGKWQHAYVLILKEMEF